MVYPHIFTSFLMNYIDPTGKNEVQLMPLFTDENLAFQHALHWGLLADGTPCELCGQDYELVPDRTVKYGYRVKCHFCNTKKSILHNTLFTRAKLPICKVLHLLFLWSQRQTPNIVSFNTGLAESTVINFFQAFRDACVEYYQLRARKIGGRGFHVQIDESQFVKRKANVGRIPALLDIWVFGGICYETNEVFAEVVTDRSSATLFQIICERVQDYTAITTDGWPSYQGLDRLLHYSHYVVFHNQNFMNPVNGANTQKIERFWRDAKKCKRLYEGIQRKEVESHVAEAVWRKNRRVNLKNSFAEALELIRQTHYE